jgi:hypothetical protein
VSPEPVTWYSRDGAAEVAVDVLPELFNVIGSMHSSGLIALVDAAGLAGWPHL